MREDLYGGLILGKLKIFFASFLEHDCWTSGGPRNLDQGMPTRSPTLVDAQHKGYFELEHDSQY